MRIVPHHVVDTYAILRPNILSNPPCTLTYEEKENHQEEIRLVTPSSTLVPIPSTLEEDV